MVRSLSSLRRGGLRDRTSGPGLVWNRIPDEVRRQIVDLARECPELSSRELVVRLIDTRGYFVSEASVYRLLKAHDQITSPAYLVSGGRPNDFFSNRAANLSRASLMLAICGPSRKWTPEIVGWADSIMAPPISQVI